MSVKRRGEGGGGGLVSLLIRASVWLGERGGGERTEDLRFIFYIYMFTACWRGGASQIQR